MQLPDESFIGMGGYPVFATNGALVHRWVAENYLLHRKLNQGEVVHHKNRNKLDYSIENLEVFSSQYLHDKLHKEDFRKYGFWSYTGKQEDMYRFGWHSRRFKSSESSYVNHQRRIDEGGFGGFILLIIVWGLKVSYDIGKFLLNIVGGVGWTLTSIVERYGTEFFEIAINKFDYWQQNNDELSKKPDEHLASTTYGKLSKSAASLAIEKTDKLAVFINHKVNKHILKAEPSPKLSKNLEKSEIDSLSFDLSVVFVKMSIFVHGVFLLLFKVTFSALWLLFKLTIYLLDLFFRILIVIYERIP